MSLTHLHGEISLYLGVLLTFQSLIYRTPQPLGQGCGEEAHALIITETSCFAKVVAPGKVFAMLRALGLVWLKRGSA